MFLAFQNFTMSLRATNGIVAISQPRVPLNAVRASEWYLCLRVLAHSQRLLRYARNNINFFEANLHKRKYAFQVISSDQWERGNLITLCHLERSEGSPSEARIAIACMVKLSGITVLSEIPHSLRSLQKKSRTFNNIAKQTPAQRKKKSSTR